MKVDFAPPFIDTPVIEEVIETLKSGWITTGSKVKLLEKEIGNYTECPTVLCVNSWTSAAIMVLRWLGLKPGDEVIIPAYTYAATAFAVMHAGAVPVMVDITDDLTISLESVHKAINSRTKAIIPVDVSGWPCDYDGLFDLVNSDSVRSQYIPTSVIQQKMNRILVLSDAAHSFGAKYHGKNVGMNSDITIFSMHAVKNLTTAEGGAICLNLPLPFDNYLLYEEFRCMSMNCQSKDAYEKSIAGSWKYDIIGLGLKINLPDVNASIALGQLSRFDSFLKERRRISEYYNKAFLDKDWTILPKQMDAERETSYHVYPLRIKGISEEQRDAIISEISKFDVAINVHYIPLPMFSFFKNIGYQIGDYPNCFSNYICEISLPIYPQLTRAEQDFVIQMVIQSYERIVTGL